MLGGLIFGMLWFYRKFQISHAVTQQENILRIEQSMRLSAFGQLSVVEFQGKKILLSVTKNQISKIAEAENSDG